MKNCMMYLKNRETKWHKMILKAVFAINFLTISEMCYPKFSGFQTGMFIDTMNIFVTSF